eukprot:15310226-Alexandrium_andersonii.AAC.1
MFLGGVDLDSWVFGRALGAVFACRGSGIRVCPACAPSAEELLVWPFGRLLISPVSDLEAE